MSSHVRFSDSLRVVRAMRWHSAAFARYSSFLLMRLFPSLSYNRRTCGMFREANDDFPQMPEKESPDGNRPSGPR
jgi:hypothetical protein